MRFRLNFGRSLLTLLSIATMIGCGSDKPTTPVAKLIAPDTTSTAPLEASLFEEVVAPDREKLEPTKPEAIATKSESPSEPVVQSTTEAQPAPAKPKRESIYDESVPGKELIAAAVRRAKRDHKHVMVEWGGNWCGWCHRLHDLFTKNPDVRPIMMEEFELVLVDSNSNQELLAEYAGQHQVKGFPHLTVLDSDGKVLTNQDTEPLEEGNGHSPKVVSEFLKKWIPARIDAQHLLSTSLKTATEQNKRIIVRVGQPYCGWCKVLAQFMQDHEALFAKDYLDVKIDTLRMTHGAETAASYLPEGCQGDPWVVILDGTGKTLATSVGPKGNIGYPFQPEEIAHFVNMIRQTRQTLSDAELEAITADLETFRVQREKKLAEQASKKG